MGLHFVPSLLSLEGVLVMQVLSGGQKFQSFLRGVGARSSGFDSPQLPFNQSVSRGYLATEIRHHQACQKRAFSSNPWLFVMSPPCQGMSSNGAGRISASIAAGKRPAMDERNRLVIPGVEIMEELRPSWFILENAVEANGKHRHQQRTWRARKHPRYARSASSSARVHHPIGHH